MAKYPKTRILVGDKNRFAELFSLKESSDGTLMIVPKSGYWMVTDDILSKIKTEHISIHPSANSETNDTTIKNTIVLEDREMTSVAAIENSREQLVWPIYTKCTSRLNNDDFHYGHDREAEIKLTIAEKINPNFPMLYTILVQRKNGTFPEIENFSLKAVDFKEFVIGIYYTYLLIPPMLMGYRASISTRPPRIKDISNPQNSSTARAASYGIGDIKDLVHVCCEQAARNQTRIFMQEFLKDLISLPDFVQDFLIDECSTISKDPDVDFYSAKVAYLPWICGLMQIDDSKEFKKALRLVSRKKETEDDSLNYPRYYKLTSNSYKFTKFNGLLFNLNSSVI